MSQMAIALIILGVTILCFIFEPVPLVVSAVTASILYAFTGLIKMEDVFVSYNTNTIVLMIAMMIIGSSLFHSGISEVIGEKMSKFTGNSEKKAILVTMIASCALSSVCTNIGVMTALAPLVTAMCLSAGIAPSKALLALLFGAQLGGFNTLVGVPSNVFANSLMVGQGYESFRLFDITPFGLGVCVLGSLYFAFFGSKMLRDTGYIPEFAQTERKQLDKRKAVISCTTLFVVLLVIAISPDAVPMHIAAVIGALVIVGTRCMTVQEASRSIDWNCAFLMGSLSALSAGLQNSGVGTVVAEMILKVFGQNPSTFLITTADVEYGNNSSVYADCHLCSGIYRSQRLSGSHDRNVGRGGIVCDSICRSAEYAGGGLDKLQIYGFCQGRHTDGIAYLSCCYMLNSNCNAILERGGNDGP